MESTDKKDFFISYNQHDEDVAQWIAWVLEEEAKYKVVIEAWDFRAGGNFAVEMDRALKQCERLIAVMSPHFLSANYVVPEWASKFSEDPQGLQRLVVPVIVEPCDPSGLLGPLVQINLTGLDREAAKKKLLAELAPGRAKPATEPPFPTRVTSSGQTISSGAVPSSAPTWQPLNSALHPRWRENGQFMSSWTTLEVHSFSLNAAALESRALRETPEALVVLGRQNKLFEQSEPVQTSINEDSASAYTDGNRDSVGPRGFTAFRDRELSSWTALPHDYMGSIYDEEDVRSRISALLALHLKTGLLQGDRVAFAVSVAPITSLMIGSAGDANRRNSAQLLFAMSSDKSARIEPTESIALDTLAESIDAVAEELTAKLALRLESIR